MHYILLLFWLLKGFNKQGLHSKINFNQELFLPETVLEIDDFLLLSSSSPNSRDLLVVALWMPNEPCQSTNTFFNCAKFLIVTCDIF